MGLRTLIYCCILLGTFIFKLSLIYQIRSNHQLENVFKWAHNFSKIGFANILVPYLRRPAFTEENSKFIHVSWMRAIFWVSVPVDLFIWLIDPLNEPLAENSIEIHMIFPKIVLRLHENLHWNFSLWLNAFFDFIHWIQMTSRYTQDFAIKSNNQDPYGNEKSAEYQKFHIRRNEIHARGSTCMIVTI